MEEATQTHGLSSHRSELGGNWESTNPFSLLKRFHFKEGHNPTLVNRNFNSAVPLWTSKGKVNANDTQHTKARSPQEAPQAWWDWTIKWSCTITWHPSSHWSSRKSIQFSGPAKHLSTCATWNWKIQDWYKWDNIILNRMPLIEYPHFSKHSGWRP